MFKQQEFLMNKASLLVLSVVAGLLVLPACTKKKKIEQTEQQQNKEQRAVEAGKELVEWCEHTKWCGCPNK